MNGSRSGPREHAQAVGPEARDFAGKVRRMLVTRTSSPRFQVTGHTLLEGNIETRDAEVFQGVGFYALPADDGDTEAIVAFVGGPGNPIVIGIRQEAVRRSIAGDLSADETQVHNSGTLIRIKRNGTVEIRSKAGVAEALPTMAMFTALQNAFYEHLHNAASVPTGPPLPTWSLPDPPPPPMPNPGGSGTTVLKAE